MPASPASYATLGLPPGADRAAVDRAYRALMKRHHPDRGGDPARAASINHAYADITRTPRDAVAASPTDLAAALYARHHALPRAGSPRVARRGSRGPLWLLFVVALGVLTWIEREWLSNLAWDLQWRYFPPVGAAVAESHTEPPATPVAAQVRIGKQPFES